MSETNHNPLPKRWKIHHLIPGDINEALKGFTPLMRQLLYNRGFTDADSAAHFIDGTVGYSTAPFLIKDMPLAVDRLHQAIVEDERIVIYGDYDADGVTSATLLYRFFDAL